MTKEEVERNAERWLEIIRSFIDKRDKLNVRRDELLQEMKQFQEDYIKALPVKIGDKIMDEDGRVGQLSRIVPYRSPSERFMCATLSLTLFFHMEKKDGTYDNREVYVHGFSNQIIINMNRNQAKKFYPILQAFAEGEAIECRTKPSALSKSWQDMNDWTEMKEIEFWNNTEYRIKPEPKYRPFKDAEECWAEMQKHQPFGWTKLIGEIEYSLITDVDDTINYSDAIKEYTFADGTPFGVKEEEQLWQHIEQQICIVKARLLKAYITILGMNLFLLIGQIKDIHYSLDLFIIGNMVQIIFSQCARFIRLMKLRKLS